MDRRRLLGAAVIAACGAGARRPASARALQPVTIAHSVSTFAYGQHLIAKEKRLFEEEGLAVPGFVVPGGGTRVVNALTSGGSLFALGDSSHPLKATEKGREARILFATDTRCSYASVVAIEKAIPYARVVDLSFLRRAEAKYAQRAS